MDQGFGIQCPIAIYSLSGDDIGSLSRLLQYSPFRRTAILFRPELDGKVVTR